MSAKVTTSTARRIVWATRNPRQRHKGKGRKDGGEWLAGKHFNGIAFLKVHKASRATGQGSKPQHSGSD